MEKPKRVFETSCFYFSICKIRKNYKCCVDCPYYCYRKGTIPITSSKYKSKQKLLMKQLKESIK